MIDAWKLTAKLIKNWNHLKFRLKEKLTKTDILEIFLKQNLSLADVSGKAPT